MKKFIAGLSLLILISVAAICFHFFPVRPVASASPAQLAVLCSNDQEICRTWANSFTKRTNIAVSITRLPTSEALARIRGHAHNPEFDIWIGGPAEAYVQADQEGLLSPYKVKNLDQIPTQFRASNHTWTGVYASLLGFCSSRSRLAELGVKAPTSWQDLLNPHLRYQIAASSPLSSGTAYSIMWTQNVLWGDTQKSRNYLQQLYDNVNQFTRSGTAPATVVKRSEAAVALTFAPYCDLDHSPDLVLTFPQEGTGFEIGAMALLTGSHHRAEATRWLDYFATATGQESGRSTGIKQLTINLSSQFALSRQANGHSPSLIEYDVYQAAQHKEHLIKEFADHYFQYRLGK